MNDEQVILWIKNFEVTPEERLSGYTGNFARIFLAYINPKQIDAEEEDLQSTLPSSLHTDPMQFQSEAFYTLLIEKLPVRVANHPQRKMLKRAHPNWGHPKLRQIKYHPETTYPDWFSAHQELELLNKEYPAVSTLTRNSLYIIIYSKNKVQSEGSFKPIQKWILEIVEEEEGRFAIKARVNPVQGTLKRDKINIVSFSFFG